MPSPSTIPPSERIRELTNINADVAGLLTSASHAVGALTTSTASESMPDTAEGQREAFVAAAQEFLHGLQGVAARLRRQAVALEEAGIITPDALREEGVSVRNGGLGGFDVGWLNSRGDKVGRDKEGELVAEARDLLKEVLEKKEGGG
ncbi:uncharacterized protein RCC_08999 [Ramularia collo-cygni]|uniref:Mediator of RNA polymerase II transcription subunit 11 n=1 Tax=Ramularia collo-cygni TaxID=112498 RepID=A0A2D3VNG2_9PEZI|nr:uncharacterized protein RCC_08999 [Ramularia collo-cygni]CZT23288.1 uncharacterized protein RCC_08999 [Ramularia collo-cygni]